jgi:hypothetical protein
MTRRAHHLATVTLAGCTIAVIAIPSGQSWPAVIVGLAVLLSGVVLLRDVWDEDETHDGVTTDDTFGRIVHPSAWGWDESGRWDEPTDGVPSREDRA